MRSCVIGAEILVIWCLYASSLIPSFLYPHIVKQRNFVFSPLAGGRPSAVSGTFSLFVAEGDIFKRRVAREGVNMDELTVGQRMSLDLEVQYTT